MGQVSVAHKHSCIKCIRNKKNKNMYIWTRVGFSKMLSKVVGTICE